MAGLGLACRGSPFQPSFTLSTAVFRVLCFRFLYSGLLLVFQVIGNHFLGEPAPFRTGVLYLDGVSFSLWGTHHIAFRSHFVFAISNLKNLALPQKGQRLRFSMAPHGAWYLGPSREAGGVNDDDHTCQLWRAMVTSVVMSSCLFLGLGTGLQTVAASGLLNSLS